MRKGTHGKECAEDAYHDGQEDDEEQAKGTAFVSGRLGVYGC